MLGGLFIFCKTISVGHIKYEYNLLHCFMTILILLFIFFRKSPKLFDGFLLLLVISWFLHNPKFYSFSFIISFIIWIVLLQIDIKNHLVFKRILVCRWHEEIISCIKWNLFLPLNSNYFCYYLQIDPQTHDLPW